MAISEPSTGSPQVRYFKYSPDVIQNHTINGRIIISSLVILFFIALILFLLHLYAKCFWRSSGADIQHHPQRLRGLRFFQETSETCGLDTQTLVALPVFTYRSQFSMSPRAVECVVCLSEFQQDEICKFLPKCKHFFHQECIDKWFLSNKTCPLCRTTAENLALDEEHAAAGSTVCHFTYQDGGNELGPEQHQESPGFVSHGGLQCGLGIGDGLACGSINGDEEQGEEDRGALSGRQISQQSQAPVSRRWRRSVSDKSPRIGHGVQFPTNILLWDTHMQVASPTNRGHWQVGGRSVPHITIDILTPQESLVEVSSCPCLRSSPELCHSLSRPEPVHDHLSNRLKSLKRLLSK